MKRMVDAALEALDDYLVEYLPAKRREDVARTVLLACGVNPESPAPKQRSSSQCFVTGCETYSLSPLCPTHFRALTPHLKERWWIETGYGLKPPSDDLVKEINRFLSLQ